MDQVVLKVVSVTPPQSPNCNPQLCPVDFNSSKLLANFIFDGLKHLVSNGQVGKAEKKSSNREEAGKHA